MNIDLKTIIQLGLVALQQKDFVEAEKQFSVLVEKRPLDHENLISIGSLFAQHGQYDKAKKYLLRAMDAMPLNTAAPYNLGLILALENNHEEAIKYYTATLALDPRNIEALINQAASLNDLNRYEEAAKSAKLATQINPNITQAWSNLGIAYRHLGRYEDALAAYDHAIQISPEFEEAIFNKGLALSELGRSKEALPCFELIAHNQPGNAKAWLYLGNTLYSMNLLEKALDAYDHGLALDPNYFEAWSNRGNLLGKLFKHSEALLSYDKALEINNEYAEAFANKGHTLFELEKYEEALECFLKAYDLNQDVDYLLGSLVFTKLRVCNWENHEKWIDLIENKIKSGGKVCSPFFSLAISESLEIQSLAAKIYSQDVYPENLSALPHPRVNKNQKIRIAYLSSDFRSHAVSFLTAELFELHDRNRFEVIAFSSSQSTNDDMQLRLKRGFDKFIDIKNMSDEDVATLSRSMNIDIAVDLGGHTKDSRSGVLAHYAAPLQINYLGFPGTMGSSFIDYIIADQTVIPETLEALYTEKVIYLPHSYQANDSKRRLAEKKFRRSDFLLPEDKFVFCCFNNPYKFSPKSVDSWIRILQKSQNTILWLFSDHASVEKNLRGIFQAQNIDQNRIIFSGKLSQADYLSRYTLADLFLDTLPFNGGTTASDALWAGLPVLTLPGEAYASRMAGSLLNSLNLSELIASSAADYENIAVNLSQNPEKTAKIRAKLELGRANSPLFDSLQFTKNIEKAYIHIFKRYLENLSPERCIVKS